MRCDATQASQIQTHVRQRGRFRAKGVAPDGHLPPRSRGRPFRSSFMSTTSGSNLLFPGRPFCTLQDEFKGKWNDRVLSAIFMMQAPVSPTPPGASSRCVSLHPRLSALKQGLSNNLDCFCWLYQQDNGVLIRHAKLEFFNFKSEARAHNMVCVPAHGIIMLSTNISC
jgi:hypothetical protein